MNRALSCLARNANFPVVCDHTTPSRSAQFCSRWFDYCSRFIIRKIEASVARSDRENGFFYVLYAFSRFGIQNEDSEPENARWRATFLLLMLECWMFGILAAIFKRQNVIDLLNLAGWKFLVISAVFAVSNRYLMNSTYDRYRDAFNRWSDKIDPSGISARPFSCTLFL